MNKGGLSQVYTGGATYDETWRIVLSNTRAIVGQTPTKWGL